MLYKCLDCKHRWAEFDPETQFMGIPRDAKDCPFCLLERLKKAVAGLPKTSDGVPIIPGMKVSIAEGVGYVVLIHASGHVYVRRGTRVFRLKPEKCLSSA